MHRATAATARVNRLAGTRHLAQRDAAGKVPRTPRNRSSRCRETAGDLSESSQRSRAGQHRITADTALRSSWLLQNVTPVLDAAASRLEPASGGRTIRVVRNPGVNCFKTMAKPTELQSKTDKLIVTYPYPIHRPIAKVVKPHSDTDKTFAGERLNGQTIRSASYSHCSFIDISFKSVKLQDSDFQNCIFVGCYFRRTTLSNCKFTGCRFYDCQFPKVALNNCNFQYTQFRQCQIPFDEMEYSLPAPQNIREQLCRNLSIQSANLGLSEDYRRYRESELKAREENLWNMAFGRSSWYREHYRGIEKPKAFCKWLYSKSNGLLWGYGDRLGRLLVSFTVFTLIIFPSLFLFLDATMHQTGDSVDLIDIVYFSVSKMLRVDFAPNVIAKGHPGHFWVAVESVIGSVFLALFAACIVRRSLRR